MSEAGIDRTTYLALAKQWVWHTLGLLRPDLLIVDTFPRGSFGELLGALDLCRHAAFVYRPVRAAVAERPDFQTMLSLYDLLLVPETDAPVLAPLDVADRLVHVGPVLSRERWELHARSVARSRLGIGDDKKCVFVSAGGGGDRHAESQIASTVRALSADPELAIVVGTGPLYRGQPFPGVTCVPGRAAEWSLAFDVAVCSAGYNTFGELMFAGVPTAFLPQEKLADDQLSRAKLAVRAGAASLLDAASDVHGVVRELLRRPDARAAARSVVPENGARVAAAELLRLLVPPANVDRVEAALDDERLGRAHACGRELEIVGLAPRLAHGREDELADAVDRSRTLLEGRDPEAVREIRGLVDAVARGLPSSSVDARATVCDDALSALASLGPGDGSAARAAVVEGRWGGAGHADGVALAEQIRMRMRMPITEHEDLRPRAARRSSDAPTRAAPASRSPIPSNPSRRCECPPSDRTPSRRAHGCAARSVGFRSFHATD